MADQEKAQGPKRGKEPGIPEANDFVVISRSGFLVLMWPALQGQSSLGSQIFDPPSKLISEVETFGGTTMQRVESTQEQDQDGFEAFPWSIHLNSTTCVS